MVVLPLWLRAVAFPKRGIPASSFFGGPANFAQKIDSQQQPSIFSLFFP